MIREQTYLYSHREIPQLFVSSWNRSKNEICLISYSLKRKSSLNRKLVANYDKMVVEDHCDIPWEAEDQDTDLHIHLDDTQEEAPDAQAYLVDGSNVHFFHHNDLVDLGEVGVASDDNDEDAEHESDHAEHQGSHCSNDDEHGDAGMDQVVVLSNPHAFQDD